MTWRQLLKRHGQLFLHWLRKSGRAQEDLKRTADQLAGFLMESLEGMAHEQSEAPVEFWNRIPTVRSCCNDVRTFEKPFAAEAYAYVHFLERYRRTWKTLEHLLELEVLPLGVTGVRVLDIGTGPAPALYAISDLYSALTNFAEEFSIRELQLPSPRLACVEKSLPMVRFFHRFSEYSGRRGPFGIVESDFVNLQLASKRARYRRQTEAQEYWDEDAGQYGEICDLDTAYAEAERLYRFRLIVLSNFLTLDSDLRRFENELQALFEDLRAGGVVIVLGATGDSYQRIYERIALLARGAGLTDGGWHRDHLGEWDPNDAAPQIIKEAQHRVYQHLERLAGPTSLRRESAWPDYWTAQPSSRARPRFALRVYRRGRWPKTSIDA